MRIKRKKILLYYLIPPILYWKAVQKIGEKAVDRALNWVMDRMQGVYGGTQVL